MGRERRNATRVPLAVDFCLLKMDEDTNVLCIPRNISATGILLDLTLEPDLWNLVPGDVVVLDNFPETMHQLITSREGEVVWTRQGLCGVRFFSPLPVR
jgi:hypothetical protein